MPLAAEVFPCSQIKARSLKVVNAAITREEAETDKLIEQAEIIVRQKLSAAVRHKIPIYEAPPEEPKKARRNRKR